MQSMQTLQVTSQRLKQASRWMAVLLVLGALAVSAVQVLQQDESHFDDAYMFLRYAHHLIHGHGLSWNIGERPVYGATSLGYLLWISTGLRVWPFRPDQFLVFSSWLFGVLSAGILLRRCRIPVLSAALFAGLLIHPVFSFHTLTGIDTTFAIFTNTLLAVSVVGFMKNPSLKACIFTAFLGYFNFLARPDNFIYSSLFPLLSIGILLPREKVRYGLSYGVVFCGFLAADTLFKIWMFGSPVPLSAYVKAHGFYPGYWAEYVINPLQYFNYFLSPAAPFLALSVFFLRRRHVRMLAVFYVPVLLTCAVLFQTVQIMGFPGRFFMPALPYIVMPALLQIEEAPDFSWRRDIRSWFFRLYATGVIFLSAAFLLGQAEAIYAKNGLEKTRGNYDEEVYNFMNNDRLVRIQGWKAYTGAAAIGGHMPEGASVAATEYGYLSGHYPHVPIIDMAGLHDPHLAAQGFSAEDILNRKPDLIWLPHWAYTNMLRQLWESESFWKDYEYYPQVFDFGIAIRRRSPYSAGIKSAVWEQWQKLYPGISMESMLVQSPEDLQSTIQKASLAKSGKERKPS